MKPRTSGGHYVHCDVANPDDVTRLYDTAVDAFGTFDNAGISLAQDGSIVNVASFVALMGSVTSRSAYTASKGAVLALTRELGVEFARKGIRINSVCPGPVNTSLLRELLATDPAPL